MNTKQGKRGGIEVFLTREFFNSLVAVLTAYIDVDETNKYSTYAKRIKDKVMKYGRKFMHDDDEQIVIYFYEEEAAILIKLFAVYVNAIGLKGDDFYSMTERK